MKRVAERKSVRGRKPIFNIIRLRETREAPGCRECQVSREFDRSAVDQRADIAELSVSLRKELTEKGLQFNDVDRSLFRDALRKTSFYADWQGKFGDEAWKKLQEEVGPLT